MWLVRHLERIRQHVLEDMKVVKTLCEPIFPGYYEITNKYVEMYHNVLSQHVSSYNYTCIYVHLNLYVK